MDMSKSTLLGHCRAEVVETLIDEFDEIAGHSDATKLEILVAAATFALMTVEFIPDRQQRTAILNAALGMSLQ